MAGRIKNLFATIRLTMPSHAPAGNIAVREAEGLTTHLLNQAGDMTVQEIRIIAEATATSHRNVMYVHRTQIVGAATTEATPAARQAAPSHVDHQEEAAASRQDQIAVAVAAAAPLGAAPVPRQEAAALVVAQEAALQEVPEAARQAAQEEAQAVEEENNSFINKKIS